MIKEHPLVAAAKPGAPDRETGIPGLYRSVPLGDTGAREHNRGKLKMMPTDWDDAEGEWVDGTHQERG